MSPRHVLLAAAIITPSLGFASVDISTADDTAQVSSITATIGSDYSVVLAHPSQQDVLVGISTGVKVINFTPFPLPAPIEPYNQYGAGSVIYVANDYDFTSDFSSAPRVIAAPFIEVAPGALQVILEPSSVPENGTGTLWALGGLAVLLASRRKPA